LTEHQHRHSRLRLAIAATLAAGLALGMAGVPRKRAHRRVVRVKPLPRTYAGIDNVQALAPFFKSLAGLEAATSNHVVRILQFGDSHTAADFWSGRMRQRLQFRFGDAGPGFLLPARPCRGYAHDGVTQNGFKSCFSDSLRDKDCDGLVGLTGAAMFPSMDQALQFQATFTEYRIHMLGTPGDQPRVALNPFLGPTLLPALPFPTPSPSEIQPGPLTFEKTLASGQVLKIHGRSGLPVGVQELNVSVPPGARLLGVELRSGKPGVLYDELGLNGAELMDLEHWNPELRRALLEQAEPTLLVLAYGTNDEGRKDMDPAEYKARAQKLFRALKEESGASILVVGPLDRVGTKRGQMASLKAGAKWVIQALREAALSSDCAFWDAREAMGGEDSILAWQQAGLARKDLVHLTAPGYQRLADSMADSLMKAYEVRGTFETAYAPETR
jgi:lysophospholipase L1-like esterase